MKSLLRTSYLLMLALPMSALADPVTVVTHSEGMAFLNQSVLDPLGLDYTSGADELPYALTLSSTFDWTGPLPARGQWVSQGYVPIVVDFRIGSQAFHYTGMDLSSTVLYTLSSGSEAYYHHEVWIDPESDSYGYSFKFTQMLTGPVDSLSGGGALTPGNFHSTGAGASFGVTAYYSNDEYTFSFPMGGDATSFSIQVTSPVPEPAPFVLLAVGLLTLNLRRRVGRAPP